MKTYKQLQESITKALKMFGSKGIRKVEPNVEFTEFGKTTKRFNPDLDGKQFNRTQDLKSKYSCLLYTSPSPRDGRISRMPSSA